MMTKADLEDENARLNGLLNAAREAASVVSEEFSKVKTEKANLAALSDSLARDVGYWRNCYTDACNRARADKAQAAEILESTIQKAALLHASKVTDLKCQFREELLAERARCDTMAEVFDRTLQTLANRK